MVILVGLFSLSHGYGQNSSARAATIVDDAYYVDGINGSDINPGTQAQPWKTIQEAVNNVLAGDTIYVRGGQFDGIKNGWVFQNSGTQSHPITLTNYPGEQVVFKVTTSIEKDRQIFVCNVNPQDPPSWQTPKADFIKIIGTDVTPNLLSNGVESKKGIVIQGMEGEQSAGILVSDCDYWEVAGIDFIEMSSGIFTEKNNFRMMEEHSTDHWYVHDNRVYNFYRESGMQFNGDDNRIENNEIYKVTNRVDTPYNCQLLNILGDNNVVRGNVLSRSGSTASCHGILLEWDLADMNTIEQNLIFDVTNGIDIEGGDSNVIRNNVIYVAGTPDPYAGGIEIKSYDNRTDWPCNEETGLAQSLLPPNDPDHPDYQYYYNPRNCHSFGNQIYNNTIHGFVEGIRFYDLVGENTIIRNNIFSGWTRGSICFYKASDGTCKPFPEDLIVDHNADSGAFGFEDLQSYNFNLSSNSPLIDMGYDLGNLVTDDFNSNLRPEGGGFDIGAFEARHQNIIDDVSIDIDDVSIDEGDSGTTEALFTVTLSSPSSSTVTVDYNTVDGSATTGDDFTAISDTLTFNPGETTQEISVQVIGDLVDEGESEAFTVMLSGASNATIIEDQADGTIIDDDGLPALSIADQTVLEGNSGTTEMLFTVTLSSPAAFTVTVDYEINSVYGDTGATAGADFIDIPGTLTFDPGETSRFISVQVIGDTEFELDEQFSIFIDNANVPITVNISIGYILNDDNATDTTIIFLPLIIINP